MTRNEIADYCTKKLGITDSATLELASDFAKRRWSMLWNNALWRQSITTAELTTTPGEAIVELPSTMEFATAVRYDDRALAAEASGTQLAIDPVGFGQPGEVISFMPISKTVAGIARIQLHRVPETAKPILVIGKLKCPELALGNDVPLIPGCDECLCAFVLMDLCESIRQYESADRYKAEANALLNVMKSIEVEQVAIINRFIPLNHGIQETY